jgi:small subunit ribosomal protein S17
MVSGGQYGGRKVREGVVVSDKMQKTVVVAVEANTRHRLYKKIIRRVRRFMAHDESSGASLGDRVRIVEGRPLSRHKRWQVVEVLERAELPEVAPGAIDLELLGEVKTEEEVAEAPPQEAPPQEETGEEEPKSEEAPAAEAANAEEATEAEPATDEEQAEEVTAAEEAPGDEPEAAAEEAPAAGDEETKAEEEERQ